MHVGPRSGATHHAVQTRGGGGGIGGRGGDGPVVFALLRARVGPFDWGPDPPKSETRTRTTPSLEPNARAPVPSSTWPSHVKVLSGNGDPAAVQHASFRQEVVPADSRLFRRSSDASSTPGTSAGAAACHTTTRDSPLPAHVTGAPSGCTICAARRVGRDARSRPR